MIGLKALFRPRYFLIVAVLIMVIIVALLPTSTPFQFVNASLRKGYVIPAGIVIFLLIAIDAPLINVLNRCWNRLMGWIRRHAIVLMVVFLILLWLFVYMVPYIFISIQPGQGGVLWKRFGGGTVTDRYYSEGIHVIFPWDNIYNYDLRYQQHSKEFEVLSSDGLLYNVEVTVRFRLRPEVLGFFHKCVGPHYVETLVFPEVASVTRLVIAQLTPDELYMSKRQDSETDIKRKLEFGVASCYPREDVQAERDDLQVSGTNQSDKYFEINDVFIRRVILPPKVAEAIENKLIQRQQMLEYDYRIQKEKREAERKIIEANGIKVFQDIVKQGLSQRLLQWRGIDATLELAKSSNSKIVIIGSSGSGGLPLILGHLEASESSGRLPKTETGAELVRP